MLKLPTQPFADPKLKDNVTYTTSATLVVQTYVNMILQQAPIKLDALPKLPDHQAKAQRHGKYWNDHVVSSMATTTADIIGYANQFTTFYSKLVHDANDIKNLKSKDDLVEGLKLLHDTINKKYENAKTMTSQLTIFYDNLTDDHKNFDEDYKLAKVKIEGDSGELQTLSKRLDAIQDAMHKDICLMAGGAVTILHGVCVIVAGAVLELPSAGASTALIGGGVLVVGGGVAMESIGAKDYSKQISKQKKVNEKIASDNQEMTALKHIKGQLSGLSKASAQAIAAAQVLMSSWQTLGSDLKITIEAINTAQEEITSSWLVDQLKTANEDWNVALEKAKQLQPNGQAPLKLYKDLLDAFKDMKPQG